MSKFSISIEEEPEVQLAECLPPPSELDPRIEALVNQMIGRIADKWTMVILKCARGTR